MPEESDRPWRGHEELYNRFCDAVLGLLDTDKWREWLDFQRTFYRYSANNTLLIQLQYPHASFVGSRKFWQARERDVTEEGLKHPISIWCPIEKKIHATEVESEFQIEGEEPESKRALVGWILGKVYDKDQTYGKSLPEVASPLAGVAPEGMIAGLQYQAEALGFTVARVTPSTLGEANGDCSHKLKVIRIRDDLSPAQTAKTMAHELGHAMMHENVDGYRADRGLMEMEAESVAYLVCGSLGLDTTEYSLGYVASWASGGGRISNQALLKRLKSQTRRIQSTSSQIIKGLEKAIEDQTLDDSGFELGL